MTFCGVRDISRISFYYFRICQKTLLSPSSVFPPFYDYVNSLNHTKYLSCSVAKFLSSCALPEARSTFLPPSHGLLHAHWSPRRGREKKAPAERASKPSHLCSRLRDVRSIHSSYPSAAAAPATLHLAAYTFASLLLRRALLAIPRTTRERHDRLLAG